MTVRANTNDEVTLLRSAGQRSDTYLWIHNPPTVFSARVNQATFTDPVIVITYDGATGSYADILPGQTLRIGSTAGDDDLGRVRIRKAASATQLFIGSDGGVVWADNAYLTVVDDFELWWKRAVLQGDGVYLLDEEILYTDQHTYPDPIPNLSCDAAAWLEGASVDVPFPAAPAVLFGTILGHAWSVSPSAGVTILNGATASPTFRITAAGTYRIGYTATASTGKTATGYRFIYVFDAAHPPLTRFAWKKIGGDTSTGGYDTEVALYAGASLSQIRPGARALIFCKDWYGATQQTLGPLAGRENILLSGWITSEVTTADPKMGIVRFTIGGAAAVLRQVSAQPVSLVDTDASPDRWTRYSGLTLDAYLWHLCHWRTTIDSVMGVSLTGDLRKTHELITEADFVWDKLAGVGTRRLLARTGVNRYNQLFFRRDPQTYTSAERASLVTTRTLETQDWEAPLDIEREATARAASLELSGFAYTSPGVFQTLFSKAPGTGALLRTGSYEVRDNLILSDQAQANELAGLALAQKNNSFPSLPLTLKANDRFLDFAEPHYLAMTLAAGDTLRGYVWNAKKLIPTRVELVWNAKTGRMHTEIECEAATTAWQNGATVEPPSYPQANIIPLVPPIPQNPNTPPGNIWFPQVVVPPVKNLDCSGDLGMGNGPYNLYWDRYSIQPGEGAYCYFPCGVRSATAMYKTEMRLYLGLPAGATYALTAINSAKQDLFTFSSVSGIYHYFGPADPTSIAGFKLTCLTAGGANYQKTGTTPVFTGSVAGNSNTPTAITGLTPGGLYCVEPTSGYKWNPIYRDSTCMRLVYGGSAVPSPNGFGWADFTGTVLTWINNGLVPNRVLQINDLGYPNFRTFFKAEANMGFITGDEYRNDDTGTLGIAIYPATDGMSIGIGSTILYNICMG